jgi:CO/xanthine dehydrogenase Mo-binding subunit
VRDQDVLKALRDQSGWQRRPSFSRRQKGQVLHGQGVAYAQRHGTVLAAAVQIEVDCKTGRIWAKKFTVAHDCGLVINPTGLKYTIEGALVQALSRTLFEEVKFDTHEVQSVDWMTYPILNIKDAPQNIELIIINRPEMAPTGAGEATNRVIPACVANAFFDATGVRLRQAPLTAERVKAALKQAHLLVT